MLYVRTSQFLTMHNVLFESQYGFREKHSTSHAILQLIEKNHQAVKIVLI